MWPRRAYGRWRWSRGGGRGWRRDVRGGPEPVTCAPRQTGRSSASAPLSISTSVISQNSARPSPRIAAAHRQRERRVEPGPARLQRTHPGPRQDGRPRRRCRPPRPRKSGEIGVEAVVVATTPRMARLAASPTAETTAIRPRSMGGAPSRSRVMASQVSQPVRSTSAPTLSWAASTSARRKPKVRRSSGLPGGHPGRHQRQRQRPGVGHMWPASESSASDPDEAADGLRHHDGGSQDQREAQPPDAAAPPWAWAWHAPRGGGGRRARGPGAVRSTGWGLNSGAEKRVSTSKGWRAGLGAAGGEGQAMEQRGAPHGGPGRYRLHWSRAAPAGRRCC